MYNNKLIHMTSSIRSHISNTTHLCALFNGVGSFFYKDYVDVIPIEE